MNPTDDMEIMKEEIFGPLLPIKEFTEIDETISYVNKNDKPLGLYYFGSSKNEETKFSQKPHQVVSLSMMYWATFSRKICLLEVWDHLE
jgi:acyl-CoA reductase-like NAD-dependent aldehyde dehydrogenase